MCFSLIPFYYHLYFIFFDYLFILLFKGRNYIFSIDVAIAFGIQSLEARVGIELDVLFELCS